MAKVEVEGQTLSQLILKAMAWNKLYEIYGEQMRQKEIDLMDSTVQSIKLDYQTVPPEIGEDSGQVK